MNNITIQPCRFCLENNHSRISVGRTISSLKEYAPQNQYNITIESGAGKPLRIEVTFWTEYGRIGHEIGIYEPKFCPECGRKLVEQQHDGKHTDYVHYDYDTIEETEE